MRDELLPQTKRCDPRHKIVGDSVHNSANPAHVPCACQHDEDNLSADRNFCSRFVFDLLGLHFAFLLRGCRLVTSSETELGARWQLRKENCDLKGPHSN